VSNNTKGGEGKRTKKRETPKTELTELIKNERIRTVDRVKATIEALQGQIVGENSKKGWSRSNLYNRRLVASLERPSSR